MLSESGTCGILFVMHGFTLGSAAWVAIELIALATIAGAMLGKRIPQASALPFAAASGLLLAVVLADLIPDVIGELSEGGLPPWSAPVAAVAGFRAAGLVTRYGCPCEPGRAGGIATAIAIGAHRALEGS